MVYCNLISGDGHFLRYAIGGLVNDITGEMEVNIDDLSYRIIKLPDNGLLYGRHIESMLARQKKSMIREFSKKKSHMR